MMLLRAMQTTDHRLTLRDFKARRGDHRRQRKRTAAHCLTACAMTGRRHNWCGTDLNPDFSAAALPAEGELRCFHH